MTLKTVQVGEYTVTEAGLRESVARVNALKKLSAILETADDETAAALLIWPHIHGCVMPRLTPEQFLQIPEMVVDKLVEVSRELNPHWWIIPGESADAEKKSG